MRLTLSLATVMMSLTAITSDAIEIVSGPYLQNVTDCEATVVWRTDKDALAWVETAPDDSLNFYAEERPRHYETDMGRAVVGKLHKVRLKGLESGKTYRYRVYSHEIVDQQPNHIVYGGMAATDVYRREPLRFSTRGVNSGKVSFCVVNDIHGDTARLGDMLGKVREDGRDFVLFNGDMVSYMDSEQQLFDGFIDRSVELFANEIPFQMVRGNHESRGRFAQRYMDYFPTATDKPYYTFSAGPVFFVVLDGGEDKPDSDIEYGGTSFCDAYRGEQAEWLAGVVESAEFRNAPFRVVVVHVPPVQDTWHGPLHAKQLFLPVLNKADVDLMLCGHLHCYRYNEAGVDGAEFPVLINSNMEMLDVEADNSTMNVVRKDRYGKELGRFKFCSE